MNERRFKNFLYGWLIIILMLAFGGIAGESIMILKGKDQAKMIEVQTKEVQKPVKFKKIMEIKRTPEKHLLLTY